MHTQMCTQTLQASTYIFTAGFACFCGYVLKALLVAGIKALLAAGIKAF